jgi:hypothetical protein
MAKFTMNIHRHHVRLVIREPGGDPHIILSKEGVVQGAPESMFHYAIGMLPLAKKIRALHGDVTAPFYANDLTLAGTATKCAEAFQTVRTYGPSVGYFTSAPKSWVVCTKEDEGNTREIMESNNINIQYTRGTRYVGGFVGSPNLEDEWIVPQVRKWAEGVRTLAKVARRFPHTAYAGLVWSLQAEWQYLSRVSQHAAVHLGPIETALREEFIPALFNRRNMTLSESDRRHSANRIKRGGLGIRDPRAEAPLLNEASLSASSDLVKALVDGTDLSLPGHTTTVRGASATARKTRGEEEKAFVATRKGQATTKEKKRLDRMAGCGAWLSRLPTRFEGNQVTEEECHDNLLLRYGFRPTGLPQQCDGCGSNFLVEHVLNCQKRGTRNMAPQRRHVQVGGLV